MKKILIYCLLSIIAGFLIPFNALGATVELTVTMEHIYLIDRSIMYGRDPYQDYGFTNGRFTVTYGSNFPGTVAYAINTTIKPNNPITIIFNNYIADNAPYAINMELVVYKKGATTICTEECEPVSGANWYILDAAPSIFKNNALYTDTTPCTLAVCNSPNYLNFIAVPSSHVYNTSPAGDPNCTYGSCYWRSAPFHCFDLANSNATCNITYP